MAVLLLVEVFGVVGGIHECVSVRVDVSFGVVLALLPCWYFEFGVGVFVAAGVVVGVVVAAGDDVGVCVRVG